MPTDLRVPLSVLDLVPVSQGMTSAEAIGHSVELAKDAERLGYGRFWMAEHHGSEAFASSATSLLLAHVAEHTQRIRVGSGGVMLPNHSPLMVAEYYGTLATIFGDRVDLGLGRAPGTDPVTAAALQRGTGELDTFAQDVMDLATYLGPERAAAPGRVRALPGEGTGVPLWMLGSSTGGAQVAALLGLPFAFASHFAPQQMRQALAVYRENFKADAPTAQVEKPTVMAGATVIAAPTQEEADFLASSMRLMQARIRTGRSGPLDPPRENPDAALPPGLAELLDSQPAVSAVGTPKQVVTDLEAFVEEHDLDELIIATYTYDPEMRRRSYALLAEEWGLEA